MLNKILDDKLKLCYIDGNVVYFTSNLEDQWGDDWDDAPYEHNAGGPYNDDVHIMKIAFDCYDISTPADLAHSNSMYSVEDINRKRTPWLTGETKEGWVSLWAGANPKEFVEYVKKFDGDIYIDLKDIENSVQN